MLSTIQPPTSEQDWQNLLARICDDARNDAYSLNIDWHRINTDPRYRGAFIQHLSDLAAPEINRLNAQGGAL